MEVRPTPRTLGGSTAVTDTATEPAPGHTDGYPVPRTLQFDCSDRHGHRARPRPSRRVLRQPPRQGVLRDSTQTFSHTLTPFIPTFIKVCKPKGKPLDRAKKGDQSLHRRTCRPAPLVTHLSALRTPLRRATGSRARHLGRGSHPVGGPVSERTDPSGDARPVYPEGSPG